MINRGLQLQRPTPEGPLAQAQELLQSGATDTAQRGQDQSVRRCRPPPSGRRPLENDPLQLHGQH